MDIKAKSSELIAKYISYISEKTKYGMNPVTALDYSSLYPSLIMTYNLSPEYLITNEEYKEKIKNKGYPLHEIDFVYNYEDVYENKRSRNIKGWTVRHNENEKETRFGLYPEILRNLFRMRAEMKEHMEKYKNTKEQMEKDFADRGEDVANNKEYLDCIFNLNYCDTKQKALKVYMNCFYGELGNKNSPLFILELAGGITSAGQNNLKKVKKYIEDKGCKVYYGDSVSADTPIYISKDNKKDVISIEELFNCYEHNLYLDTNTMSKEIIDTSPYNLDVISETGWTKIKKIIRHKTDKEMYRIITKSGFVDVTRDHSLLDINKQKVKPQECKIGTRLLHWDIVITDTLDYLNSDNNLVKQQKDYINNNNKLQGYEITEIIYLGKCNGYVYDLETESHHFGAGVGQIVVHNTDSLYFTFRDDEFIDIHKRYFLSNYGKRLFKEEYCALLVQKTFELVKSMSKEVNEFLKSDNGTRYLKMAYEEVLYPVVFLSRKKYYGIAHENIVNFKPKKLFVRGLEVKKRGVSEILRIVCMETMWQSMDIYNFKSLREMVLEKIDYLYSKEWKMEEFIQTGLWKPNKKNQTLIKYIERIIAEGRDPPDAYERFNYVIVKITDPMRLYDFKGRKIDIKKGDKMEYVDYAKKNNLQIDLDYYFEKQLTGQFARLICYDDEFHIYSNNDWHDDEEMVIEDDKTMRLCKKFIKEYAKRWNGAERDYGTVYKNIFRSANKIINNNKQAIVTKNKHLSIMFSSEFIDLDNIDISIDYRKIINEKVMELLNCKNIRNDLKNSAENIVKDLKKNKSNTTKMFCDNRHSFKQKMIKIMEMEKESKTIKYINYVKENKLEDFIFKANERSIKSIIDAVRNNINIDNTDNQEYLENVIKTNAGSFNTLYGNDLNELYSRIKKAYSMFIEIVSIYKNIMLYEDMQKYNLNTITKNNTRIINPSEFRL